jgi:hypothetical protein
MSTARVLPFLADTHETEAPAAPVTHEAFIQAVRAAVVSRVNDPVIRERLSSAKLVYGAGPLGVRGRCVFGAWSNGESHDFLEIAALGEESYVQLAGTTIHELAHCLAGATAGHGKLWKLAAQALGLATVEAGGQDYQPDHFAAEVWAMVEALPHPSDGKPSFPSMATGRPVRRRPCPLGIGTRGGKSRGTGSGSRLRLYVCGCPEGTSGRKVRVASDDFDARCNRCNERFAKPEEK